MKDNNLKYSIIVPVYNVEQYLRDCLDSVIAQDYSKDNYEVIIVDDGSTDMSGRICDEYSKRYSFISVKHQNNKGRFITRLEGIREASGEYVYFLDSDDYISKNMLSAIDIKVREYNPDFIMFGLKYCYDNCEFESVLTDESYEVLDKFEMFRRFTSSTRYNSVVCKVVRKSIIDKHIDEMYQKVNIADDQLQTAYLIKYGKAFGLMNECFYYYRIHSASVTHSTSVHKIADLISVYMKVENVVSDISKDIAEEYVQDYVNSFRSTSLNDIMEEIYKFNVDGKYNYSEKKSYIINEAWNIIPSEWKNKSIYKSMILYNRLRFVILKSRCYLALFITDCVLSYIQLMMKVLHGEKSIA